MNDAYDWIAAARNIRSDECGQTAHWSRRRERVCTLWVALRCPLGVCISSDFFGLYHLFLSRFPSPSSSKVHLLFYSCIASSEFQSSVVPVGTFPLNAMWWRPTIFTYIIFRSQFPLRFVSPFLFFLGFPASARCSIFVSRGASISMLPRQDP